MTIKLAQSVTCSVGQTITTKIQPHIAQTIGPKPVTGTKSTKLVNFIRAVLNRFSGHNDICIGGRLATSPEIKTICNSKNICEMAHERMLENLVLNCEPQNIQKVFGKSFDSKLFPLMQRARTAAIQTEERCKDLPSKGAFCKAYFTEKVESTFHDFLSGIAQIIQKDGINTKALSKQLAQNGIIKNADAFNKDLTTFTTETQKIIKAQKKLALIQRVADQLTPDFVKLRILKNNLCNSNFTYTELSNCLGGRKNSAEYINNLKRARFAAEKRGY